MRLEGAGRTADGETACGKELGIVCFDVCLTGWFVQVNVPHLLLRVKGCHACCKGDGRSNAIASISLRVSKPKAANPLSPLTNSAPGGSLRWPSTCRLAPRPSGCPSPRMLAASDLFWAGATQVKVRGSADFETLAWARNGNTSRG